MGVPNQWYIDPGGGDDGSGNGSIGSPWQTTQHALDSTTWDSANGDQFNVKEGAADVLSAPLDLTSYGLPNGSHNPCIFRGYTNVANDGGRGEISGADTYPIMDNGRQFIDFVDMYCHSSGSSRLFIIGASYWHFIRCKFGNVNADCIWLRSYSLIESCEFEANISGACIREVSANAIYLKNNLFRVSGTYGFECGSGVGHFIDSNILILTGNATGFFVWNAQHRVVNNTLFSINGTGKGISFRATSASHLQILANNYFEGFSGVGGSAIYGAIDGAIGIYQNNKFYNNTQNIAPTVKIQHDQGNNDTLLASGLVDPANGDFSPTADLINTGWPTSFPEIDQATYPGVGAVQHLEDPYFHRLNPNRRSRLVGRQI